MKKGQLRIWGSAVILLLVLQTSVSLFVPRSFTLTLITDVTALLLMMSAVLIFLANGMVSSGRSRIFWMLQVGSWSLSLVAQTLWMFYEVVLRKEVPNPFVGDVLLFLSDVPVIASVLLLPHLKPTEARKSLDTIDFTLLLLWWIYLYLFFVIPWQYIVPNEANYGSGYARLGIAVDLILLPVLAFLFYSCVGRWKWIYGALFGSQLMMALSGQVANHAINQHVYYPGSWYDVPYAMALACFTFMGILGLTSRSPERFSQRKVSPPLRVAGIAIGAVLSLPIIGAWTFFNQNVPIEVTSFRQIVTLTTIFLMGFLVFLQEHRLRGELAKTNQVLEQAALTDPLTGMRNRRFFDTIVPDYDLNPVLRTAGTLKSRQGPHLVFYLIDLDNFKEINDLHGHEVGDDVLVEIARRISSTVRLPEIVIRWGGDEFLLVARYTSTVGAEMLAGRILAAVGNETFRAGAGGSIKLTCSVGWAVFPWSSPQPEKISPDVVLGFADHCLYVAKQGKNKAVGVVPAEAGANGSSTITDITGATYAVHTFFTNCYSKPKALAVAASAAGRLPIMA